MSFNSTISDFICRFKQAIILNKLYSSCRNSKLNVKLLEVLQRHKLIKFYKIIDAHSVVYAITFSNKYPLISDIKIMSKPSRRFFTGYEEINKHKGRFNKAILSTNKGLMMCQDCINQKVGGELLLLIEV